MGIGTKRLLKIHLYEPEADFGFWHIHVERIFCEKRRRGRGKKREKEEKKKRRKRRRGFILFIFKPCIITMGFIIAINFQGQLMKNDEE